MSRAVEDDYKQRMRDREERHRQQAEVRGRPKENSPPRERREEPECRRHREVEGVRESHRSRNTQGGRQEGQRTRVAEDNYMLRRRAREKRHRQQAEERGRLKEDTPPRERYRRHREVAVMGRWHSFPPLTRPGNGRRGAIPAPRTRDHY